MKYKLYLIPGLMTDERLWNGLIPFITDEIEVVYLKIPNSSDFDEIVETLNQQIKDTNINLLGFSLGGYISSYFSCKYPNKVARLFTVSATPGTTSTEEIQRRKQKLIDFQHKGEFGLDFEKAKSLLEEQNQKDLQLIQTIVDMYNDLGKNTFITQLTSTFYRVNLFSKLEKLHIPIYMFYSNNDRLLDQKSLKELESKKHHIKLFKREGTSHNIPLEFPEQLAFYIKEWIKS